MLGLMCITAFLSMWITNIASTALMLPIVHAVLEHLSKTEAEEEHSSMRSLQVQKSKKKTGTIRM